MGVYIYIWQNSTAIKNRENTGHKSRVDKKRDVGVDRWREM